MGDEGLVRWRLRVGLTVLGGIVRYSHDNHGTQATEATKGKISSYVRLIAYHPCIYIYIYIHHSGIAARIHAQPNNPSSELSKKQIRITKRQYFSLDIQL